MKKRVSFQKSDNKPITSDNIKTTNSKSILRTKKNNSKDKDENIEKNNCIEEENNEENNKLNSEEIKNLSTLEYIQYTVQKEVQQGMLNVARLKPSNPIEYLGNYLLEKSKNKKY